MCALRKYILTDGERRTKEKSTEKTDSENHIFPKISRGREMETAPIKLDAIGKEAIRM